MNKLIRTIHPEVRIIDKDRGICDYVASDETLDCYQEVIKAEGWRFTNFKKNSPFVDSHNYSGLGCLLGKVTDFQVQGKQLIERVQWALDVPEQTYALLGWKMTAAGYLKAVSVGFFPSREVTRWDSDPKGFNDTLNGLGLDAATSAKVRCIYLEQEQIELSACIIGANPNALARAHKDGAVADADLAALGLGDEEMQYLSLCAGDEEAPMLRGLIGMELQRVMKIFRQKHPQQQTTRSDTAARDREVAGRQREAFLAELKTHTAIG